MKNQTIKTKSKGIIALRDEIKRRKSGKPVGNEMKMNANSIFWGGKYRGWWDVSFGHEDTLKKN